MSSVVDPSSEGQTKGVDRRALAIILALVGAACLAFAAFSPSWLANPSFSGIMRETGRFYALRGDIRFGPLGFEHCMRPEDFTPYDIPGEDPLCASLSTAEFNRVIGELDGLNRDKYTSGAFSTAGWIAFVACLVAAAGLITAAALVFARKQKQLPVSPASIALLGIFGALVAGCIFAATKPGPPGMMGVDVGFWAFGIGCVTGIIGSQLLAKQLRPPDPDLLADAMDPDEFDALPRPPGSVSA